MKIKCITCILTFTFVCYSWVHIIPFLGPLPYTATFYMFFLIRIIVMCIERQNNFEIMLKNITLSAQFRNHVEKYQTVSTVPKSCRKISNCQNSSEIMYTKMQSSEIMQKNTKNTRIVQKSCRKYYTVRTVQKSCRKYYTVTTVPKSCRKIPHFQNSS